MLLLKKRYEKDKKILGEWMENQMDWTLSIGKDVSDLDNRLEIVEMVLCQLIEGKKVKDAKKRKV